MNKTIENLKKLKSFHNGSYGADIDKAIKALEQQPCEDVIHRDRTVQDFVDKCRECGREKVFDKIKAEIEMHEADCKLQGGTDECEECNSNVFGSIYRIIDKYKAESEAER